MLQLSREDVKTLALYHKSAKTEMRYALQNALSWQGHTSRNGLTDISRCMLTVQHENEEPLKVTCATYHSHGIENCTGYRYEEVVAALAPFRTIFYKNRNGSNSSFNAKTQQPPRRNRRVRM